MSLTKVLSLIMALVIGLWAADLPAPKPSATVQSSGAIKPAKHLIGVDHKRVALIEFDTLNQVGTPAAGQIIPSLMAGHLKDVGGWQIEERIYLKKVLQEQELQVALLDRDEEAVELGKINGAQLIVTGSVMRIGKSKLLSARLVDVETGSVLSAASLSFIKDEDLKDAVARLSWKLMGYSDRQIHTAWTRKALETMKVGIALGSGWYHTRTEEWSQNGEGKNIYDKEQDMGYGGLAVDLNFQSQYLDLGLFAVMPKRVGLMGAYGAFYPQTHFGLGVLVFGTVATVKPGDRELGWMEWNVPMALLSLRPTENFSIGIAKGWTSSGQIRHRGLNSEAPALDVERRVDLFEGPTLAQVQYEIPHTSWFILGRYFHGLEESVVDLNAKRQVMGLERWLHLSVGGSLGL
jgi:hypothetical protein